MSPTTKPNSITILFAVLGLLAEPFQAAHAYQPYFENQDTTQTSPLLIKDPTISIALYATIQNLTNIYYFVFNVFRGTGVLVGMTIPPHEDQPDFAPTIAIIGPGLPDAMLPAAVRINSNPPIGSILLSPTEPLPFFEPFSRNSYWRRQRKCITLSKTSEYIIAVWSEADVRIGKYAIVVGDRDIRGRNPSFTSKLKSYWTPTQSLPAIKGLPAWERFAYWLRKLLNR